MFIAVNKKRGGFVLNTSVVSVASVFFGLLMQPLAAVSSSGLTVNNSPAWAEASEVASEEILSDDLAKKYTVFDLGYAASDYHMSSAGYVTWCAKTDCYPGAILSKTEVYLSNGDKVRQVTDNMYEELNPRVNNRGEIVWLAVPELQYKEEVFFYDGNSVVRLTYNSMREYNPQINDRGEVVWFGSEQNDYGKYFREIFLYNGEQIIQLTDSAFSNRQPRINNQGDVVWHGSFEMWEKEEEEIFLYDGNRIIRLTDDIYYDHNPIVNDRGEVVWLSRGGGERDEEVMLYDGSKTIWLTDNKAGEREPQRNNQGQTVWAGSDKNDYEIFFDDGKKTIRLTDNSSDDHRPRVNDRGEVVWHGGGNKDSGNQIFLYDGKDVFQFTDSGCDNTLPLILDSGYDNTNPLISDRGDIVWYQRYQGRDRLLLARKKEVDSEAIFNSETALPGVDKWDEIAEISDRDIQFSNSNLYLITGLNNKWGILRNFKISPPGYTVWSGRDENDYEIWQFDDKGVKKISDNSFKDIEPEMNALGQTVWEGKDGEKWKIFLYDGEDVIQLHEDKERCRDIQINARGQAIWKGRIKKGRNLTKWELLYYDGEKVLKLTDDSCAPSQHMLNNRGEVAWSGDSHLFLYNGKNTVTLTDKLDQLFGLNNKGQVVWQEECGEDKAIVLYDGKVKKTLARLSGNGCNYKTLRLNDQGRVVWSKDGDPFLYDGEKVIKLRDNTFEDYGGRSIPRINNRGQVAFQGSDGKTGVVCLYDGGELIQLYKGKFSSSEPVINDRGDVVWHGHDGKDWEIFLYDGESIIQLTDNSLDEREPRLNESGDVMWRVRVKYSSGHDFPAFLATRNKEYLDLALARNRAAVQLPADDFKTPTIPLAEDSSYSVIQLTDNSYDDIQPQINDRGEVVWSGYFGYHSQGEKESFAEIFLYDGEKTLQLSKNRYGDFRPQINNRGEVVWYGDEGGKKNGIFLYDGKTVTNLAADMEAEVNRSARELRDKGRHPRINNLGQVVWQGYDEGKKVFIYDGEVIKPLTEDNPRCGHPDINDSGCVVWSERPNKGKTEEIFFYDGKNVTKLSNKTSENQSPRINNRGEVVWCGKSGEDYDVILFDGVTTSKIANNSFLDSSPRLNDKGRVAWRGGKKKAAAAFLYKASEIFLYDGTETVRLTSNSYIDKKPRINDMGEVVWVGKKGSGKREWSEIFLYDGASKIQLTHNPYTDSDPAINNRGDVVWCGKDGDDYEIFLARKTRGIHRKPEPEGQVSREKIRKWREALGELNSDQLLSILKETTRSEAQLDYIDIMSEEPDGEHRALSCDWMSDAAEDLAKKSGPFKSVSGKDWEGAAKKMYAFRALIIRDSKKAFSWLKSIGNEASSTCLHAVFCGIVYNLTESSEGTERSKWPWGESKDDWKHFLYAKNPALRSLALYFGDYFAKPNEIIEAFAETLEVRWSYLHDLVIGKIIGLYLEGGEELLKRYLDEKKYLQAGDRSEEMRKKAQVALSRLKLPESKVGITSLLPPSPNPQEIKLLKMREISGLPPPPLPEEIRKIFDFPQEVAFEIEEMNSANKDPVNKPKLKWGWIYSSNSTQPASFMVELYERNAFLDKGLKDRLAKGMAAAGSDKKENERNLAKPVSFRMEDGREGYRFPAAYGVTIKAIAAVAITPDSKFDLVMIVIYDPRKRPAGGMNQLIGTKISLIDAFKELDKTLYKQKTE